MFNGISTLNKFRYENFEVLQGDEQELQQLLQDGADVLKQLFGQ